VLRELDAGRAVEPVLQWEVPNPQLYLRKDYHPRQVVQLARMVGEGLIPRYVARKHEASGRVRLVE